jgi:thiol-disulfide isomerase/thioredoxin
MRKIISSFLIAAIAFLSPNLKAQGYEIKIKIPQIKNQQLILGHYFTKQDMLIPDDTTMLNSNGVGVFTGKNKLTPGMYFVFLPNKYKFDILIGDNQKFTVENDTTDLFKKLKITGDKENEIFIDYQHIRIENIDKRKELTELYKKTTDEKEKKEIERKFKEINEKEIQKQEEIITEHPDFFFSKFLKATQEVKIPETITSQKDKYYYYRFNYFNYFDYKDKRLLRTPVYEGKLDYYLDKVLPQVPDTLIAEVDILINNSRNDKELFRNMLVHLFNKYAKSNLMGAENVWVHIAEKYYIPEATWSDNEFIEELKTKVARKKPALIGNIAPELKMIMLPKDPESIEAVKDAIETMKNNGSEFLKNETLIKEKMGQHKANYPNLSDSALRSQVIISELAMLLEEQLLPNFEGYISIHEQATKYTILYFWEPDCSHCKTETPKFSKAYDEKNFKDLDLTVIPVYLQRNINEWDKYTKHLHTWLDFVLEHNMQKWTNVWEPFGYSHYRDKYDISSSPVLYLLDKDKKIIAKTN